MDTRVRAGPPWPEGRTVPLMKARLREPLIELRDEALGRMPRRVAVEPSHLPTIAGISAAAAC